MSAAVMDPIVETSPRHKARTAGAFWFLTIVTGAFAMYAGGKVAVSGTAAATAASILANESFVRMAIAADIVATACYLAATVFVYDLLKPVNRNVSLLAAFFSIIGCAMAGCTAAVRLAPLVILGGAKSLSAFTAEQLPAMATLLFRLQFQVSYVGFLFFGLHCLLVGALILKSRFLPRFVGVLMVTAGLGWLTFSFANLLSPPFARTLFPYIMMPGVLGEFSLTLWLLVMGVNVHRWREQAGAAPA